VFFSLVPALSLNDADKFLGLARFANGNHQTAADFQLRDQRFRDSRPARRNQNSIVRTVGTPSERAVKGFYRSVIYSEFANPRLCFTRQVANPLDRINLAGELS
jgi:hypothetical protein